MLYTKRGSIPQEQTDGTKGWIEVLDKPECPEGKEVVWLNWEWIIRDPKPENREGYVWKWNHEERQWVEYPLISLDFFNSNNEIQTISSEEEMNLTVGSTDEMFQS